MNKGQLGRYGFAFDYCMQHVHAMTTTRNAYVDRNQNVAVFDGEI